MSYLILYVRGEYLAEMDIDPPDCKGLDLEAREKLRSWYLQEQILKMKTRYRVAIMKYSWEIYWIKECPVNHSVINKKRANVLKSTQ